MGAAVGAFAVGVASFLAMLVALRTTPPGPSTLALLFGTPILSAALSAWWRRDAEVIVGADGVWIGRPLRHRFVPVQDIAEVVAPDVWEGARDKPHAASLRIVLTGGERVELVSYDGVQLQVLAEAIAGVVRARDELRTRALAQLERRGRSLAEWRAALRGLQPSSVGFREAAISREQIEAALEDATLPPEQRLGAAIALGESGDVDRVRVAAEAAAEPRMRIALARIAGGLGDEEPELDAALAEAAPRAREARDLADE